MKKGKFVYRTELPLKMYTFFSSYSEPDSAPSFSKFARSIGTTLDILKKQCKHRGFALAWRECNEIRRDYLIDHALCKKFDPSFTKHLLGMELDEDNENEELTVKIRIEE